MVFHHASLPVSTGKKLHMKPTQHLVILAKAPFMGRVKTRLAHDVGPLSAWGFYRKTLNVVVNPLANNAKWKTWLSVSPDMSIHKNHIWPTKAQRVRQGFGNLGQRMDRVMQTMPPGPVIIIGADIPEIRPHHIADAFQVLGEKDTVFGPAQDGGYWLVGQRRRPRILPLFTDVRWSSPHALADTIKNIPNGVNTGYVEELSDVDDGASYQKFLQRQRQRRL